MLPAFRARGSPCERMFVCDVLSGLLQLGEAATLSASAGKGQDSVVDLDPPTMRQSVAWELALRTIRMKEVRFHQWLTWPQYVVGFGKQPKSYAPMCTMCCVTVCYTPSGYSCAKQMPQRSVPV